MAFCSLKTVIILNVLMYFSIFSVCLLMWQNSLVRQPNKTDEDIGIQFENEIVRLFRTKVRRDLTNHNAYKRLMEKHLHGMSVFFDGDSFTYPLNKTNQDSERHFEIKNGLDLVNHTVHKQVTEKNLHGKSVLTIENVSTRLLNKTNQNVERLFETQAGQNLTDHISHNNSVVQKHLHEKSVLLIGDASTRPTSKKNQNFGRHSPVEFGRQFGIEVGPDLAKQTTRPRDREASTWQVHLVYRRFIDKIPISQFGVFFGNWGVVFSVSAQ